MTEQVEPAPAPGEAGCGCICHALPGVNHVAPCCYPEPDVDPEVEARRPAPDDVPLFPLTGEEVR